MVSARWKRELHLFGLALLLALPAALPYLYHFLFSRRGLVPTGFIQIDQPQYLAYARELFDAGGFHLVYANPFSPALDSPAIYFQTQSVLLGLIWRLTGWDPGVVYLVFGAVAVIVCARVALALFGEVAPAEPGPRRLSTVAFFWGGGVLVLLGTLWSLISPEPSSSVFQLDPFEGWWFLNFGRNLIFPTEAYYHALFFGGILAVLRRRYVAAAGLALLLTLSHHFTAIELLCVLTTWAALEIYFVENSAVPRVFLYLLLGVLGIFFTYYFGLLGAYPEHEQVSQQMKLPWTYEAQHFIPAYLLVGLLAFWGCRRLSLARQVLSLPRNRLFLVWALTAFALANHELALKPMQPLHFTRGYVWTPLFLLGAGTLAALFRYLLSRFRGWGWVAAALLVGVFLVDNAAWLSRFPRAYAEGKPSSDVVLGPGQKQLLDWLSREGTRESLLLSESWPIGYLSTVYSPVRSWQSHHFTTPGFKQRGAELDALFRTGRFLPAWEKQQLLIVLHRTSLASGVPPWLTARHGRLVFENARFLVYRVN